MYNRLTIFRTIAVVAIFLGAVLAPEGVLALTFTPDRINTEVYPGVPITEELTLLNETGTHISVVLEPVMLDTSNAESGQASFLLDTAEDPSLSWISVDHSQFVLQAGEQRNVKLTLLAPETSSGSLLAGIATTFRPVRSGEEGNIAVSAVTGPFVFARILSDDSVVAGQITSFGTAEGSRWVSSLPIPLEVSFANSGDVHLNPVGTVEVRDVFGRSVDQIVVNPNKMTILPGVTRKLEADWGGKVTEEPASALKRELKRTMIGPFKLTVEMSYGADSTDNAQHTLWIIPWRTLFLLGIVLVGIVGSRRRLRKVI